jgi:hypothetical protein
MVRYPLGGNLSWVLQWLVGFRNLGHEIWFVEKSSYPDSCFNPGTGVMSDDCSSGVHAVRCLLEQFDLQDRFCFVDAAEGYHGLSQAEVRAVFESADVFIDMGTHGAWLAEAESAALRVLIELEPGYTQIKFEHRLAAGEQLPQYDYYYTNGFNIGTPESTAPTAGLNWRSVVNPVVPRLFPTLPAPANAPFTTVMNWQAHQTVEFNGYRYGQKDVEFEKFIDLPGMVDTPVEIAVSGKNVPTGRLQASGWRLRDAHRVTRSVRSYIDYIVSSCAEFGVCKNVFVATHSGWFSDRSAHYLACGRPVVIQDTGFGKYLPCGEGLFAVRTVEEAAAAVEEITCNYDFHSRRAREIAIEHLDAEKILGGFLDGLGI